MMRPSKLGFLLPLSAFHPSEKLSDQVDPLFLYLIPTILSHTSIQGDEFDLAALWETF